MELASSKNATRFEIRRRSSQCPTSVQRLGARRFIFATSHQGKSWKSLVAGGGMALAPTQ